MNEGRGATLVDSLGDVLRHVAGRPGPATFALDGLDVDLVAEAMANGQAPEMGRGQAGRCIDTDQHVEVQGATFLDLDSSEVGPADAEAALQVPAQAVPSLGGLAVPPSEIDAARRRARAAVAAAADRVRCTTGRRQREEVDPARQEAAIAGHSTHTASVTLAARRAHSARRGLAPGQQHLAGLDLTEHSRPLTARDPMHVAVPVEAPLRGPTVALLTTHSGRQYGSRGRWWVIPRT